METLSDFFKHMVTDPIAAFGGMLAAYAPNFIGALFIIIIGLVVGWMTKSAISYFLRLLKVDETAKRDGLAQVLARGGVKEPLSLVGGRVAGYIILFCFGMIALGNLKIHAADILLENFLLYLPNVFAAILVMIAGYLIANFFARAALVSAVNHGLKVAPLIARGVRMALLFFAAAVTMELLGIGKQTVLITFSIVLGGIVFGLALAFGLGGRDIARDYLHKRLKEIPEKDSWEDIDHV